MQKKRAEGVLEVTFGDECVTFFEDRIEIQAEKLILYRNSIKDNFENVTDGFSFTHNGASYSLCINGAKIIPCGEKFEIVSAEKTITLSCKKGATAKICVAEGYLTIGEGAQLKNVILDKDVTVRPGAKLFGTARNPIIIKRGEVV